MPDAARQYTFVVRLNARPAPGGLQFGALDHFNLQGPIQAMGKKPRVEGEAAPGRDKDLSHLTSWSEHRIGGPDRLPADPVMMGHCRL